MASGFCCMGVLAERSAAAICSVVSTFSIDVLCLRWVRLVFTSVAKVPEACLKRECYKGKNMIADESILRLSTFLAAAHKWRKNTMQVVHSFTLFIAFKIDCYVLCGFRL
jgi:hypothetical protein